MCACVCECVHEGVRGVAFGAPWWARTGACVFVSVGVVWLHGLRAAVWCVHVCVCVLRVHACIFVHVRVLDLVRVRRWCGRASGTLRAAIRLCVRACWGSEAAVVCCAPCVCL